MIYGGLPAGRLAIRVKQPPALEAEQLLAAVGYEESWIQMVESEPSLVTGEMAFD